MGRAPCCDKASVKKGPWSPDEDRKLKEYIDKYGTGGNWIALPHKAGLKRCGKSCRLRWLNYLRPNIKHGDFSHDEDRIICNLFATIGSRWSIIAAQLPGRTDNDIKNYWNTKLKKKLMGLPPTQGSKPINHHKQQQQQQFFPAATVLGDGSTTTGTAVAAAATTPRDHLFSLQHLAAPHQYSSSCCSSSNWSSLLSASGGLLMFGGDQQQQQVVTSSSCWDNGGLYFELCSNSSGNSASATVGLESFIFGGFDTMQVQQNNLFPAGHNTSGASLLDHQLYISGSSDYNNAAAGSCYEHEMKPFLVSPSGSTGLGRAVLPPVVQPAACYTARPGQQAVVLQPVQAKGVSYIN